MNRNESSHTKRPSSGAIGHTRSLVGNVAESALQHIDKRNPTELGEALLDFKKRYRFKRLSKAAAKYEERNENGS